MTQFLLDPDTGDLIRDGGTLRRVDGIEEIAQHARVRMRLFLREVFLDQSKGMNYVGGLLTKGVDPNEINSEFRAQALGTPGIVEVTAIQLSRVEDDPRTVLVQWQGVASLDDLRDRIPISDTFQVSAQEDV